jgi:putative SOS response-associated peptidase YedK
MYIRLRDTSMFGFAGVYSWLGEDRPGTAAIITTTPNELMAPIHTRMPAILLPALEDVWLNPKLTDVSEAVILLTPYPAEAMIATPVSTKVNTSTNEGSEPIAPISIG